MIFTVLLTWMMDDVKPRRNSLTHSGAAITGVASKCPKGPLEHPSAVLLGGHAHLILQIIALGIIICIHFPN